MLGGDAGPMDGAATAEPLCADAVASFRVPREPQCPAESQSFTWPAELACRGPGRELTFYMGDHLAFSAECEIQETDGSFLAETRSEWCTDRERPPRAGRLWPCTPLQTQPANDAMVLVDGTTVVTRANTCTRVA